MYSIEELRRERERELVYIHWVQRRFRWIKRLVKDIRPHYCSICERDSYCGRLIANAYIRNKILQGEMCPDAKTFWEIL